MNLDSLKSQIRTLIGVSDTALWQTSTPVAVPLRPGIHHLVYSTTIVTAGIGVDHLIPIYVLDLGGGNETAWCGYDPGVDQQRFRVLVLEWCATKVAAGWFIDVSHWGIECALGWGINEEGVVKTAKFIWETSEKLAILPVLGVPVPGAPEVV
jgi:hypothetical protein